MKNYLAGLALVFTIPVVADDHVAIVTQAFSNLSSDFHQEWAFTESVTEDGVTKIGRFDPRLPEYARWHLLTFDGREPTTVETDEYQKDKKDEFRDHDDDGEIDFINVDTLELVEETAGYWVFSFIPDMSLDEDDEARKFMENISGTVKIIRAGNYLEYIDMRNDGPIRPFFGVKISRFLTHLTFGPAGANGPIVPLSIDVAVKGRAMLFVKIDEIESTRYTNYEYAGT